MLDQILCIYALADLHHFQALRRHLQARPDLLICDWHGAPPGVHLADARAASLAQACAVVLLLSVDFLNDSACRAAAAEVAHNQPIPVLLRATTLPPEFASLAVVPGDGVPLVEQPGDRDAQLLRVAQAVFAAVSAGRVALPRGPVAPCWSTGASSEATARAPLSSPGPVAPVAMVDPLAARNELTLVLKQRFRQSERHSLLHRLGIDPEDVKLRPEDREEFARAMVLHLDNLGRLAELWDQVARERAAVLGGRCNPFR